MTKLTQIVSQFRTAFVHNDKINHFPMHMARGLMKMQQTLKNVDCILEVHDARIPLSGRNPKFDEMLMVRPRVLLLNKIDLVEDWKQYESKYMDEYVKKVLCISCKQNIETAVKKTILPTVMDVMLNNYRYNRKECAEYNLLIVGVPNVGKSSLINTMRSVLTKKGGKASAVGAKPGITRSVLEKIKVSENPRIYVLDTPGILPPSIPNPDVAYKLALCATIPDTPFDLTHLCDFLLFSLNNLQHFDYVERYQLKEASDDINEVLLMICKMHNLTLKHRSPSGGYVTVANITEACKKMLRDFRRGLLGKVCLDKPLLLKPSSSQLL